MHTAFCSSASPTGVSSCSAPVWAGDRHRSPLAIVPSPPIQLLRRQLYGYAALRLIEVDRFRSPSRPADHQFWDSDAQELHRAVQGPRIAGPGLSIQEGSTHRVETLYALLRILWRVGISTDIHTRSTGLWFALYYSNLGGKNFRSFHCLPLENYLTTDNEILL